jgi:ribonuclease Z
MKRKALVTTIALTIILGLAATLYRTPGVQDFVLKRAATAALSVAVEPFDGMRAVVCGSASPLGQSMDRAQACIAVVTPEHLFLIDVGARSPVRIAQARLPLARLNGVLLTHYHSDHIAALPDINLQSWVAGRTEALRVYGPTGIGRVVNGFNEAYALDRGYRSAHHGEDLLPPNIGPMEAVQTTSGVVWQDESMTVTTFKVEHDPIDPAMGYRFDYKGRSIVVSGDSNAVESLFTAAQNADVLFHDALARHSLDITVDALAAAGRSRVSQVVSDVHDYHADSRTLEAAAEEAGIAQLVLYHLVPTPANGLAETMFRRGLKDDTILANDLQVFDLPLNSDQIILR